MMHFTTHGPLLMKMPNLLTDKKRTPIMAISRISVRHEMAVNPLRLIRVTSSHKSCVKSDKHGRWYQLPTYLKKTMPYSNHRKPDGEPKVDHVYLIFARACFRGIGPGIKWAARIFQHLMHLVGRICERKPTA